MGATISCKQLRRLAAEQRCAPAEIQELPEGYVSVLTILGECMLPTKGCADCKERDYMLCCAARVREGRPFFGRHPFPATPTS